ncbi:MAG: fibrobacter succinogenes major paralogous domain-containing protein [Saprospiraceae bacterium]|nr:fibrobacter succinogenes major paralogous domain-containing protein [Saprospiraceae bacterium]
MKKSKLFIMVFLLSSFSANSQEEKLEIQGAIQIGDSEDPTPDPGTIRWTGSDFEGWNGISWLSLTSPKQYVKDIDNNSYEIVTIGTQVWMAENLRATRFNDGAFVPLVTDNTEWSGLTSPGYTWYDNGDYGAPDYGAPEYGALYNWFVLDTITNGGRNICPTGWHVPSDEEWTTLIALMDPSQDPDGFPQSTTAGQKLKETGLAHWNYVYATNESGFTGLPAGGRNPDGSFFEIGLKAYWFCSTSFEGNAIVRELFSASGNLYRVISATQYGASVRCLKN